MVLSSPSAAGKSRLAKALRDLDKNLEFSVSVTTRKPRKTESNGEHYIFTDRPTFKKMEADGRFIESAEVFGNLYGTPKKPLEEALGRGEDVVFDVDWQGGSALKKALGKDTAVLIFLLPPSLEELKKRIIARAEDSPAQVEERMKASIAEISHWREYDYVLVNDNFAVCLDQAKAIIAAARLRLGLRRRSVVELVKKLTPGP